MNKLKKLTKKPFVRNVMIMATGTAAAQLVTISLTPIITRLYGPEAYGLMGVFMAIVAIIAPISALTYPIAIVLPRDNKDAAGLMRLSLYLTVFMAVLVLFIILLFNQTLVELFQIENVAKFLYLLPVVVLFSGALQIIEQWLIRTKQFGVTAKVTFIQALVINGGKAVMGIFQPLAMVLILFSASSNGLKAIMMMFFSKLPAFKDLNNSNQDEASLMKLGKTHKDFPIFRAPQVFINAASQSLPILMLTSFFGPASAGFYSIGRTVLSIPTQLIGKSVGDVFYPRISEAAYNKENITNLIKKATFYLGLIGILPFGFVIIFGPWVFTFVFGSEWTTGGEYARWIALWMFFMFINQPSVKSLPVLSAQSFHLKFTIGTLVVRASALAVGYFVFSSDMIAVMLFGISGAVLNMCLIFLTLKRSLKFDT